MTYFAILFTGELIRLGYFNTAVQASQAAPNGASMVVDHDKLQRMANDFITALRSNP